MIIHGKDEQLSGIYFNLGKSSVSVCRFEDSVVLGNQSGHMSSNAHLPYDVARALAELLIAACDAHDDASQLPANAKVVTP